MTPTVIGWLPASGLGVAPLGSFAAGDGEVHEDQGRHRAQIRPYLQFPECVLAAPDKPADKPTEESRADPSGTR
ncbi:hypothetical protein ACH4UV_34760 [Streptomyces sp. NPDC020802]|uniref:hypothetical protein n=1 Tax=Streptomyces sp. NPDC020802 TaxID=3365094 RepID=UPI0037A7F394